MSQKLIQRRDVLKGILKRVTQFARDIPPETSQQEVKVKLQLLEKNFELRFDVHMAVMELTGASELEFQEIEFEAIQDYYEKAKARLLDYLGSDDEDEESDDENGAVQRASPQRAEIKLPQIQISPSGAQKLHYLKSFLTGEAAQLVRAYSVTDGNYRVAWSALDTRYNNKRLLVNALFQRLFGQASVTKESAMMLRQLIDNTSECVQALKALDMPTDKWDAFLVYIVTQRLDADSHKQWEISLTDNEFPSFDELVTFMEKRCRSLEAIGSIGSSMQHERQHNSRQTNAASSLKSSSTNNPSVHHTSANPLNACSMCDAQHSVTHCKRFRSMNVAERREIVMRRRMCFLCLRVGHVSADCSVDGCSTCSGKHHEMLHFDSTAARAPSADESGTVQANFGGELRNKEFLLPTALVRINDSTEMIRALLDQASQATIIRESCAQRLGLQRRKISVPIKGIGGVKAGTATTMANIKLKSCVDESLTFDVTALVMRDLTGALPNKLVISSNRPKFVGIHLADPTYYEPGEIDLIIGADVYGSLLLDGLIVGSSTPGRERPTVQNSALGWIVSGGISSTAVASAGAQEIPEFISLHIGVERDLRRFWEIEEVNEADRQSDDEKRCEAHFVETHERDSDGRYIVRLLFASSPTPQLGDSRNAAERRLRYIERRLRDHPDLRAQYRDFMDEYASLGHMRIADKPPTGQVYYLPHHFVVKESSSTTRLRVVFDASCKTSIGRSLNELQLIGPRLQDDLAAIVMRIRRHAVALTADIAKMYRQVRVNEGDWDLQRILWRSYPLDDIKEWQLTTVTYGMAASPFLAVRALQQLARDEQHSHPLAASVVLRDFYVDDLITGCDSVDEAMFLQRELCSLMACGGFELRKWSSNCNETLQSIPVELRDSVVPLQLDEDVAVKILGLRWLPATDCFAFKVTPPACDDQITKRSILSVVARLFDPVGFLAPSVIVAKMIIQQLWTLGITWDDLVPEPLRSRWMQYHKALKEQEQIKFPRWIGSGQGAVIELHGFADASEAAYGGVIYVRCTTLFHPS